jgi:hypothetical protein
MFALVHSGTNELASKLPELERQRLQQRRQRQRLPRSKQVSDGVMAMSSLNIQQLASSEVTTSAKDDWDLMKTSNNLAEEPGSQPIARRERTARRKAQSEGVALMASMRRNYSMEMMRKPVPEPGYEVIVEDTSVHNNSSFKNDSSKTTPITTASVTGVTSLSICKNHENDDDNDSVDSDSSGYSDVNDVPEVDLDMVAQLKLAQKEQQQKRLQRVPVHNRLARYYTSRTHVIISNVFGTMVAFFFVGQRVESFLRSQGISAENVTHYDFAHKYIFWLLTAWFGLFIMISGTAFAVLYSRCKDSQNKNERRALIAATIDLVLCGVCLSVLMVAEAQRCCLSADPSSEAIKDVGLPPCSCPPFGARQYGGLGTIEPYTSLIALRVLRFWVAKMIVSFLDRKRKISDGNSDNNSDSVLTYSRTSMPFAVFSQRNFSHHNHKAQIHSHEHNTGGGHGQHGNRRHGEDTGTPAELWEKTIGENPEVVQKYGEFSGEILRAMLGLPLVLSEKDEKQSKAHESDRLPAGPETIMRKPDFGRGKSFTLEKQYSSLPSAAQEVIMAGKLGKSVSIMNLKESNNEAADLDSNFGWSLNQSVSNKTKRLVFQLDENAPKVVDSMYVAPNARLVRSMRRCDRKFLPILGHWNVVDVVMTRYEMVYFEATGVDDALLDQAAEGTRQALIATKGGKGLRLCDVAKGRQIVGHLEFAQISSVHVERSMPGVFPPECPDVELPKNEFWKQTSGRDHVGELKRGEEWSNIKEDCLRIHTMDGNILYLRFYADLEDAEHHPSRLADENEETGFLFKNNAIQWAQTIGRFCTPAQLNQQLPHFGDNSSEELRDYLVIKKRVADDVKGHHHRRNSSTMVAQSLRSLFGSRSHEQADLKSNKESATDFK